MIMWIEVSIYLVMYRSMTLRVKEHLNRHRIEVKMWMLWVFLIVCELVSRPTKAVSKIYTCLGW